VKQYTSDNLLVRLKDQPEHHMTNDRHFTKYTYDWTGPGSALFIPVIAFFNHDNADTNCAFLISPTITTFIHQEIPDVNLNPIVVMTLRQIRQGDELTLNYYPRTMGVKTLSARMKELKKEHGITWRSRATKSESKFIQFFNKLNHGGTAAKILTQNFDQTEEKAREYLSKIYRNDGRSTPEYLDVFVYAIMVFRVVAAINLQYASKVHNLTEQQITQKLRTDAEPIRQVLESNFNCTIDTLKQTFAKLRTVLSGIEIHGPTSCINPYQQVHRSQSLYSFVNRSIGLIIPGLEVQRATHSTTSSRSTAAPLRTGNPFLDFWFRGGIFQYLKRPSSRRPSEQELLADQKTKKAPRAQKQQSTRRPSNDQQIQELISPSGLLKGYFHSTGGSATR